MKKRKFILNQNPRLLAFLIITIFVSMGSMQAQSNLCGFDKLHQRQLKTQADYKNNISENEKIINSMRNNRSGNIEYRDEEDVISIPTVVHIIYTDSIESNISDAQVYSAIQALNDDFRKRVGTQGDGNGVDTEIEFCLAQYDEWGEPTDGINRVHCTGNCAMGYDTIGISPSINEDLVKDLSRWPIDKYYNIWIVHKIGEPIPDAKGFSYLPGGDPDLDGTVILFSAFGKGEEFDDILEPETRLNRTLTHHTGHYLDLYDTYEGDNNGTQCPPNFNCDLDGDKCCDTPPHIRSNGDCNPAGTNSCANDSSNVYFVHNYMDASSESCKNEFTVDQSVRMWYLLTLGSRKSLLESMGCEPNYNQECINQNNGFEEFDGIPAVPNTPESESFDVIEGWNEGGETTPWYCYTSGGTYVGVISNTPELYSFDGNETFVSEDAFELETGKIYEISFDYSIQKNDESLPVDLTDLYGGFNPIKEIIVAFTDNPNGIAYNSQITTSVSLKYPQYNYPSSTGFNTTGTYFCYPGPNNYYYNTFPYFEFDVEWVHHSLLIKYNGSTNNQYLNLMALNNSTDQKNVVYFDNVCLNENPVLCEGDPYFEVSTNECSASFTGSSTGQETDLVTFTWDFGDGTPFETGESVEHDYLWTGNYKVCVTMDCGNEKKSYCDYVDIGSCSNQCKEYELDINARQCDQNGEYIANFKLDIPEGYDLCNPEDGQAVFSDQADITTNSYVKHTVLNVIYFSISINPDDPDFNDDISINITLCSPDGEPMCYKIISSLGGDKCDECNELMESEAVCTLTDPNGGKYKWHFWGTVDINPPPGSVLNESYSNEAYFSASEYSGGIIYEFYTHDNKPFQTSAMFVYKLDNKKYCYNVTITAIRTCPTWKGEKSIMPFDELKYRTDKEKVNSDLKIYPNPANNFFFINTQKFSNINYPLELEVIDYNGRVLLTKEFQDLLVTNKLDVSSLRSGIYLVRFRQNNKLVATEKIVIID